MTKKWFNINTRQRLVNGTKVGFKLSKFSKKLEEGVVNFQQGNRVWINYRGQKVCVDKHNVLKVIVEK